MKRPRRSKGKLQIEIGGTVHEFEGDFVFTPVPRSRLEWFVLEDYKPREEQAPSGRAIRHWITLRLEPTGGLCQQFPRAELARLGFRAYPIAVGPGGAAIGAAAFVRAREFSATVVESRNPGPRGNTFTLSIRDEVAHFVNVRVLETQDGRVVEAGLDLISEARTFARFLERANEPS